MGGLGLLIMIYFVMFCFMMDPRARCWHIALQMAYCTHAEKEYGVYGRSIEDLVWDMTGMTLVYSIVTGHACLPRLVLERIGRISEKTRTQ